MAQRLNYDIPRHLVPYVEMLAKAEGKEPRKWLRDEFQSLIDSKLKVKETIGSIESARA